MDRGIEHREEHTEVNYIVAHGISTTLYGEKVVIGSRHFILEDEQSDVSDEAKEIITGISTTNSAVYLAIGGKLVGIFLVEDPPRKEAKKVIELASTRVTVSDAALGQVVLTNSLDRKSVV